MVVFIIKLVRDLHGSLHVSAFPWFDVAACHCKGAHLSTRPQQWGALSRISIISLFQPQNPKGVEKDRSSIFFSKERWYCGFVEMQTMGNGFAGEMRYFWVNGTGIVPLFHLGLLHLLRAGWARVRTFAGAVAGPVPCRQ
jgi:hypothetical protein